MSVKREVFYKLDKRNMEVKIKSNEGMIDATIEMIDGVMVVSPKKVKFEPKEGDIITCTNSACSYTLILKKVEKSIVYSYAVLLDNRCFKMGDWSSYKNPRPATEEEKQKLFQAIADEGLEWDVEKRQFVKMKWKPKYKEFYFRITFEHAVIIPHRSYWTDDICDKAYYQKGWCFKTKEECQAFCDRLNESISSIKP